MSNTPRYAKPYNAQNTLVMDSPVEAAFVLEEQITPSTLLLPLPDILEHSDAEPFRYCLNTSTLRGHKLSLPDLVDIAAAAGYEAIEPWIDEIEKFASEGGDLRDLAARIRDLGLTVESGIGFFEWIVDDPPRRAKGLEAARHSMGMLARIGGRRIAAPPWGAHENGLAALDWKAAPERYRVLLEIGDQISVVPQVEFWGFSANLSRLGEAALLAIESGHPDACILADIYHLQKGGSPVNGMRLLGPDLLKVFHVNDFPPLPPESLTDADRVFPGDGVAPLRTVLRDLRDIRFTGFLSLELFNPTYYTQEPLSVARTGLEKLRDVVQSALEL